MAYFRATPGDSTCSVARILPMKTPVESFFTEASKISCWAIRQLEIEIAESKRKSLFI